MSMYLRHTATDYNLHIPAVKTAGYPYLVPTGLYTAPQGALNLERREATLNRAARRLTHLQTIRFVIIIEKNVS